MLGFAHFGSFSSFNVGVVGGVLDTVDIVGDVVVDVVVLLHGFNIRSIGNRLVGT